MFAYSARGQPASFYQTTHRRVAAMSRDHRRRSRLATISLPHQSRLRAAWSVPKRVPCSSQSARIAHDAIFSARSNNIHHRRKDPAQCDLLATAKALPLARNFRAGTVGLSELIRQTEANPTLNKSSAAKIKRSPKSSPRCGMRKNSSGKIFS